MWLICKCQCKSGNETNALSHWMTGYHLTQVRPILSKQPHWNLLFSNNTNAILGAFDRSMSETSQASAKQTLTQSIYQPIFLSINFKLICCIQFYLLVHFNNCNCNFDLIAGANSCLFGIPPLHPIPCLRNGSWSRPWPRFWKP